MLVLSRKTDQDLIIGDNIRIKILKVKGNTIRLGIEAPDDVRIIRGELQAAKMMEATITIVHSDPNHATYTDTEQAVLPVSKSKKQCGTSARCDRDKIIGEDKPETDLKRGAVHLGENRLKQLIDQISGRDSK